MCAIHVGGTFDEHGSWSHIATPDLDVEEARHALLALCFQVGISFTLNQVTQHCQFLAAQDSYVHQLPAWPACSSMTMLQTITTACLLCKLHAVT